MVDTNNNTKAKEVVDTWDQKDLKEEEEVAECQEVVCNLCPWEDNTKVNIECHIQDKCQ